jgi:hypothetical protein
MSFLFGYFIAYMKVVSNNHMQPDKIAADAGRYIFD